MKEEKIEIISSSFPTGATWLYNCLFDLGFYIYSIGGMTDIWKRFPNNEYQLKEEYFWLQKHFPSLNLGKSYHCQFPNISLGLTHSFPSLDLADRKIIFFIRDIRDSIYSHWKRVEEELNFFDFLESPVDPFPFSVKFYLRLFNESWIEYLEEKSSSFLIVRFEDTKNNPVNELDRVTKFLGFTLPKDKVQNAVNNSSFKKAKTNESILDKNLNPEKPFQIHRAGLPFEYRQTYSAAMHHALSTDFDEINHYYGYETYLEATSKLNENAKKEFFGELLSHIEKNNNKITDSKIDSSVENTLIRLMNEYSRDSYWKVVNGTEILKTERKDSFNFIQFEKGLLNSWENLDSEKKVILKKIAMQLKSLAPNEKQRNHFIHRWLVLTGDFIGA